MEKSKKQRGGIQQSVDVRQITPQGLSFDLTASAAERKELAERFELAEILSLTAQVRLTREALIVAAGTLRAQAVRQCVVSLESFAQPMEASFKVFFSEKPSPSAAESDMEEEPVEAVVRGKIDLGALIAEQFGLNLDPFPKKEPGYFEYWEDDPQKRKKPFARLKELLKK